MGKRFNAGNVYVINMQRVNDIVKKKQKEFPEYEYYLKITSQIEKNIKEMPDLSIEACKSLIEGVCKTILNKAKIEYKTKGKYIDSPKDLLQKALNTLKTFRTDFDEELVENTCSIVFRISQIRNDRGDLSHGRAVPKTDISSIELAEFIVQLTDGMIRYLLDIYFSTDFSYIELKYEDNGEFNNMLDETHPLEGILSYSKALFDQDIIAYEQQLIDYKLSQENQ